MSISSFVLFLFFFGFWQLLLSVCFPVFVAKAFEELIVNETMKKKRPWK